MKPIEVKIVSQIEQSPEEICTEILDTARWSEFTGYSILPGIKEAHFETKTISWVGSKIKVQNTDGSSHVEEIIEYDTTSRIVLKLQEFSPPLKYFATHFIEVWDFRRATDGTEVSRKMTMFPKGIIGSLMLIPISKLMQKAFEKNLADTLRDGKSIKSKPS